MNAISSQAELPVQINMSPHAGEVDFSKFGTYRRAIGALDPTSVADLLRNAFVYPPHSIYRHVKVATSGFDSAQDLHANPRFHYARQSAHAPDRPPAGSVNDTVLVDTYHRLLCEAVLRTTAGMQSPWLLQSGGKDSTSMSIALAEARPQATCITYLGGSEENELDSAQRVARQLGLRHETLVCKPARAYDRYLASVARMPLLTADFAVLSYVDLVTEIAANAGDGVIDALGSDPYFGVPTHWQQQAPSWIARRLRLPQVLCDSSLVGRSFKLCYALGTMQMDSFERFYPGSRFTDSEVDALLGRNIAEQSRQRLQTFQSDIAAAGSTEARRRVSAIILEAAIFGKGMFAASALALRLAYPYCDEQLAEWVFHKVPDNRLIGPDGTNKILVRKHIARHFQQLPYVQAKGSFRFDLCGLARERFDQVYAFALQMQALLPGAPRWLESHRRQLGNKYFASKFYLLAIILPWLLSRAETGMPAIKAATPCEECE